MAATRNIFPCNILNLVGEKFVIFWIWCDISDLVFEVSCKTYPVCFLEIEKMLVRHNCRCDCCMENTRNNILKKLTNSKWGCMPHTLRTSTLAPCYTVAKYACPVWSRSVHASKLDPVLNNACRTITGCLKPTNTSNLHLLAGIAPSKIRREREPAEQKDYANLLTQGTHYLDLSQHQRGWNQDLFWPMFSPLSSPKQRQTWNYGSIS